MGDIEFKYAHWELDVPWVPWCSFELLSARPLVLVAAPPTFFDLRCRMEIMAFYPREFETRWAFKFRQWHAHVNP
jgi:hypothetical protein